MNRTSLIAILTIAVSLSSCGSSKEKKEAEGLLAQSKEQLELGNYETSLALLDSISRAYPEQTGVRREAMHFRPSVIEKQTLTEISRNDSLSAEMKLVYDNILPKMKKIDNPELVEGYWISENGNAKNIMDATGIQARVSDDGEFYIISEVNGAGNLHHSSFTLSNASGQAVCSDTVPYDGELNYRINGSETVTYSGAQTDSVGVFAIENSDGPLTLTFIGENGKTKKITLNKDQVIGIANAYVMANSLSQGKLLVLQRELLEKKLALARDQRARTLPD